MNLLLHHQALDTAYDSHLEDLPGIPGLNKSALHCGSTNSNKQRLSTKRLPILETRCGYLVLVNFA